MTEQLPDQPAIYRITYRRYGSAERSKTFKVKGTAAQFLAKVTDPEDFRGLSGLEKLRVEYATLGPWVECQEALADYRPASHKKRLPPPPVSSWR